MSKAPQASVHEFGGDWTSQKLKVLASYLAAYTTALQRQPFRKAYIDAFAGTGSRASRRSADKAPLFPDLEAGILDGSARAALLSEPRFDKYIFIEQNQKRCRELQTLKRQFPSLASDIDVRRGEANEEIQDLCGGDWRARRAVLFLDPYGMQVEWATIEAVARIQAIDMWLLFPLGIGVNRLLTKSGDIPEEWKNRLDLLLGTSEWYDEFYQVEHETDLFGDDRDHVVKASMATIGKYFNRRLEAVFAGVAEPGILRNSMSNPMYLLCFAVGNPGGRDIALRIAAHLLKGMR
jgi:three-Cys-motif partner protein